MALRVALTIVLTRAAPRRARVLWASIAVIFKSGSSAESGTRARREC